LLKHRVQLSSDDIAVRAAPSHLIRPPPLTFALLEQQYCNLLERKFTNFNDVNEKRPKWLADLGLEDCLYQTVPSPQEQEIAIEMIL
jgi:hypothetical protein